MCDPRETAVVEAAKEWRISREHWRIGSGHDWRITNSEEDRTRFNRACEALERALDALA